MECNEMENTELISAKAKIYFDKDIAVHCVYHDGKFVNGLIDEWSHDFCFVSEFNKCQQLIFFRELKHIETYVLEKKGEA